MAHLLAGLSPIYQVIHPALATWDHYQEDCHLELLMVNRYMATQHATVLVLVALVAATQHLGYSWLVLEGRCLHLRPIQGMVQDTTPNVSICQ